MTGMMQPDHEPDYFIIFCAFCIAVILYTTLSLETLWH
jgi:hypothetical protein